MPNFRSRKLLDMARDCPKCFCCYQANVGDVVAAHSNQHRDGKGTSLKAHDYRIAFVCSVCHDIMDGRSVLKDDHPRSSEVSREDRKIARFLLFEDAHRATIGYLFETGIVVVA